ncbi:MAG: IclR family transcriptional regulator [Variovorax sp.]|jgi:DNA-binding IclR family transcriptional regulator|nr:MAG: IclR family transcriptional regulator [Variovorax sp.]
MDLPVKSALRVLELLELFDRVQRPLVFGEIIALTGYPQSSCAALLATLTARGYFMHDRRRSSYMPTRKLSQLGAWVSPQELSSEADLIQLLEQARARTGETVVVAERTGNFARYVHVIRAAHPLLIDVQAGMLRPLCTSAVGLALLSEMDPCELSEAITRVRLDKVAGSPEVRVAAVKREVAEVRRRGFAMSRGRVTWGAGMIAMPLSRPVGSRRLTVGIGGPLARLDSKLTLLHQTLKDMLEEWSVHAEGMPGRGPVDPWPMPSVARP